MSTATQVQLHKYSYTGSASVLSSAARGGVLGVGLLGVGLLLGVGRVCPLRVAARVEGEPVDLVLEDAGEGAVHLGRDPHVRLGVGPRSWARQSAADRGNLGQSRVISALLASDQSDSARSSLTFGWSSSDGSRTGRPTREIAGIFGEIAGDLAASGSREALRAEDAHVGAHRLEQPRALVGEPPAGKVQTEA